MLKAGHSGGFGVNTYLVWIPSTVGHSFAAQELGEPLAERRWRSAKEMGPSRYELLVRADFLSMTAVC